MSKLKTKDQILTSALEVFQEKGFDGARMQEIADKANINKGLLHYYFKSKEKIFAEVFNLAFANLFKKLSEISNSDSDLFDKLDRIINSYIDVIKRNSYLPIFVFQEINRNPKFVEEKLKMISDMGAISKLIEQIEQYQSQGRIKKIDPRHLIVNILSLSVFPFIAKPMLKGIFKLSTEDYAVFVEQRKEIISDFVKSAILIENKTQ